MTILIGANDACPSTDAAMTPVGTFQDHFEQPMTTLSNGLPRASATGRHHLQRRVRLMS
jgi:hypothetical protein